MTSFFLLFLTAGLTQAATYCPPFAKTNIRADHCEDNYLLGTSADNCLSAYMNDLKAGKAKVQKILDANAAQAKSEQNAIYKASGVNFDQANKELAQLILSGTAAKLSVDSYLNNIFMPEDYDNPEVTGMSTAAYLAKEPCYATPHKVMSEDSQMLAFMLDDLKATQADIQEKSKTVKNSSADMNSVGNGPSISKTVKKSDPNFIYGKDKNVESDVTKSPEPKKK